MKDPLEHLYDVKCMSNVQDKYGHCLANKSGTLNGFIPICTPNKPHTIEILQCNYYIARGFIVGDLGLYDYNEWYFPYEEHCYGKTPFESLQKVVAWRGFEVLSDCAKLKITWLDRYGKESGSDEFHCAESRTIPIPLRTDELSKEDLRSVMQSLKEFSFEVWFNIQLNWQILRNMR